ncbi:MAG TPA: HD domain-containing phosphohydrolase [Pyrinomonadaceae bacterium]|nr:HD domain-containing phosphohydrolase [Pyrinomonadaceae bacterium]
MNSILAETAVTDEKLLRISSEMDEFEGYDGAHGRRIAALADALAAAFNLASRDRFFLQQASLIHDIGEMSMNRDYIRAARVLTESERIDLHRHPVIGEQDAAKLGMPRGVQLIVRWHHEWWNGSGYPDGLEGDQTPLAARILRVADAYGSLTADRPFRAAWPDNVARKYLVEWAGIEFDPFVVKTFIDIAQTETARSVPASSS